MIGIMDFDQILDLIVLAGKKRRVLKICYPKTENSPSGWREVEPYSFSTDIGSQGEHLTLEKEEILPGHILDRKSVV